MAIRCPNCGHSMNLKDSKPGKFKPKCPKCEQRFALTVPDDPLASPTAAKLEDPNATLAPAQKTVVANPKISATDATLPPAPLASSTSVLEQTMAPSAASATRHSLDATIAPTRSSATVSDATMAPATRVEMGATEPGVARDATRMDSARPAQASLGIPEILGGYKLMKELGRGAMGAVYLAKQLSLDRNVALKLIQAQWASNPVFVARFTREAYAAAQLTHHNVVQIYDLGAQGDTNYFSMEFVKGQSLADLVEANGKLDPEQAVGYVLQAARGLDFAHRHGMVHRDVKPANLMLNEQGIVKVADLGLVKTPQLLEEPQVTGEVSPGPAGQGSSLAAATADVTMANVAMGTPAYMAPEQAEDAAGVDHRADIYSLGCTMYVLLTGRPPFEGASALEVITKHRTEPIVRPEVIVKRIPPALSEIVLKMVAKDPADRYQTLTEVVAALESFLGIKSAGPFSPSEENVAKLDAAQKAFNASPLARLRGPLQLGFIAAVAGLFVVFLFVNWLVAGFIAASAVAAVATYFVTSGVMDRTYLFDKVRSYILSMRISDWLTVVGGSLLTLLVLYFIGWLLPVIGGAIFGSLLGAGFYFAIDRGLAKSRGESLQAASELLKSLRIRGVDEEGIQQFVVKYSSDPWEEFFEGLFGYEAKLKARDELAKTDQGRRRPKYRAWRDGLIRQIDTKLRLDREERDRQYLRKIELANLTAQGIDPAKAREQANLMADALLGEAAEVRTQKPQIASSGPLDPKVAAAMKRAKQLQMLSDARHGRHQEKKANSLAWLITGPVGFTLGAKPRFLVGALLIAIFAMWVDQNTGVADAAKAAGDAQQKAQGAFNSFLGLLARDTAKEPTEAVLMFNSFAPGVAGLVLLVLGLFRGWKMSLFAWPAAAIALLMPGMIGYGIAGGLAVVGLLLGRTAEE